MSSLIAIRQYDKIEVHITASYGSYATICGMDGDDPGCGQYPAEVPKNGKVSCLDCYRTWQMSKSFKRSDFILNIEKT